MISDELPIRCTKSASSEPLSGTAPLAHGWLLISSEGSWGPKAVDNAIGGDLSKWVTDRGIKVLLVRQHDRDSTQKLRYWLSNTRGELVTGYLSDFDTPPDITSGEPADPMLVICTNGSRDQCCAIEGISLRKQLQESLPESLFRSVWEGTHIGGHRFAPTALYLPGNLVYGRLTPDVAASIVRDGTFERRHLRGRSQYPACVQVLECEVPDFAEIVWKEIRHCPDTQHRHVGVRHGEEQSYELTPATTQPRLESCGGNEVIGSRWLVTEL